MAPQGEEILSFAADAVFAGQLLGRVAHHQAGDRIGQPLLDADDGGQIARPNAGQRRSFVPSALGLLISKKSSVSDLVQRTGMLLIESTPTAITA